MNHGDVEIVDVDSASGVASAGAPLTASPAATSAAAAAVSQVELADFPLPVHLLDGVKRLGLIVVTENHLLLKLNGGKKVLIVKLTPLPSFAVSLARVTDSGQCFFSNFSSYLAFSQPKSATIGALSTHHLSPCQEYGTRRYVFKNSQKAVVCNLVKSCIAFLCRHFEFFKRSSWKNFCEIYCTTIDQT